MKRYILVANRQNDIMFQYADFSFENNMSELFFDFSKTRIGLLKTIKMLGIKDTKLNYNLIFKNIFNKTINQHINYKVEDEYIFIVMARVYEKYGNSLVKHLRIYYPSCKLVIYMTDLICNMRFSLKEAKKQFDIVCSFDKRESEINNIYFVLEPFSTRFLDSIPKYAAPQFDVSFVGAAKGRYDKIMWLYYNLTNKGLKCDFYIVGVNKKDQVRAEGLHYEWLDFEKVLKHAANSKCIIELMQPGEYSATTRFAEAVLLNKNLLTDCPALQYLNDNSIHYFNDTLDFSPESIREVHFKNPQKYIDMLSIRTFIETIDKHLLDCKSQC